MVCAIDLNYYYLQTAASEDNSSICIHKIFGS